MKILKSIFLFIIGIVAVLSMFIMMIVLVPIYLFCPISWGDKIESWIKQAKNHIEVQESKSKKRQHPHLRSRYSHN